MLGWIALAAAARVPMNGVLVGGSVAADVVWLEPTVAESPDYFRVGPDFGFELWGSSGKRTGGVRAGMIFQGGFTSPGETTNTSFRLGGGVGVGGIWGTKGDGTYGTAHGALGLGGYGVNAQRGPASYGSVGVWTRFEYAAGMRLGKHGALEIGPYAALVPPIRIGEGPWKGDYWGQMGLEVTLMAFGSTKGGGGASDPSVQPRPVRDTGPGSDPTPPKGGSDSRPPGKQPKGGPGSDSPKTGKPGSDSPPPKGGKKGGKKDGKRGGR